jgi:hypothetical protein
MEIALSAKLPHPTAFLATSIQRPPLHILSAATCQHQDVRFNRLEGLAVGFSGKCARAAGSSAKYVRENGGRTRART